MYGFEEILDYLLLLDLSLPLNGMKNDTNSKTPCCLIPYLILSSKLLLCKRKLNQTVSDFEILKILKNIFTFSSPHDITLDFIPKTFVLLQENSSNMNTCKAAIIFH